MQPELSSDLLLKDAPEIEGYKLLGPCVLHSKVGQGGMGAVYRGQHLNLGIEVAVKCLLPGLASLKADLITRFQREAHLAARVTHQNLVRVYDVGEQHGLHYLVMEYVIGESLRERISRRGRSSIQEAVTILYQAAKGLAAAHDEGIVHRDIKPENIMICETKNLVKVADLGLSRLSESVVDITAPHVRMGTPPYMPPEQWESFGSVGRQGDVWALGAALYYMLAGQNAFQGTVFQIERQICSEPFPDVLKMCPDLPQDLVEVLRKSTEKGPEDRYQNARELEEALEHFIATHELATKIDEPLASEPKLSPAALKRNTALPAFPQTLLQKVRSGTAVRAGLEATDRGSAGKKVDVMVLGLLLCFAAIIFLVWHWTRPVPSEKATARFIDGFEHVGANAQGFDEYVHKKSRIRMVYLPGGTFWMGSRDNSPEKDEKPRHNVSLSPFLIAKYELSQEEWEHRTDENPAPETDKKSDHPVSNVTWIQCNAFCQKLGLSLPTEAQWEFACRANQSSEFAFGDDALTSALANFNDPRGPRPINSYAPNDFGIFNMHGNVFEWCQDSYDKDFYTSSNEERNPLCTVGEDKVVRGGGFLRDADDCRSAKRRHEEPGWYEQDIGFRPAFTLPD